jgi:lipoate-protein ligase B
MHGFALNVNTDMSFFELIKPCGFTNEAVCSMRDISGHNHQMEDVKSRIKTHFSAVFGLGF